MIARMLVPSLDPSPPIVGPSLVRPSDAQILRAALARLDGRAPDFEAALAALHEAVVALIPAGRVYLIGRGPRGPIVGSLITGIGITAAAEGVALVRVEGERVRMLGRFGGTR